MGGERRSRDWAPPPGGPALDPRAVGFAELYYASSDRTWTDTWWLGSRVYKCPLDLWIYQELLFDVRPDVVVECGTNVGGSAHFLASMLELLGHGRVVTIDVEALAGRPHHPRITYLTGSSVDERIVRAVEGEIAPGDVVMVILDSDHSCRHVGEEMQVYAPMVTPGSYLIVEDTTINGHPVLPDFGPGPMEAVDAFLAEGDGSFAIDRTREKFFLTFNPRGYLRRRGPGSGGGVPER